MISFPVEESACYRCARPRIEEIEPFRLSGDWVGATVDATTGREIAWSLAGSVKGQEALDGRGHAEEACSMSRHSASARSRSRTIGFAARARRRATGVGSEVAAMAVSASNML